MTHPREFRPVAALDVDGVFALQDPAVPVREESVSAYGKWRRRILVPDNARELIGELGELFDCVWISAWSHTAHPALREALGLPSVPWDFLPVQFHKLDAIRRYAVGRPWVLIDDSIDDLGDEPAPGDGILCRVDSRRGIADVHPRQLYAEVTALSLLPSVWR
jgi:hypothetical protein